MSDANPLPLGYHIMGTDQDRDEEILRREGNLPPVPEDRQCE